MSKGLVKAKEYDWKDSNLALFGSSTEKGVKKDAAKGEPAWKGAGQKVSLKIWRIVKLKVTDWPEADYGKFYGGDSYIILNTYKPDPKSEELAFDLHFWIGSESSQDEYGTAAYKTVELDTYLDDAPVQHREVQGHESDLFLSYFKNGISIMAGGAESGFRHVKPEEYKPRLLHFCGVRKNIVVKEVPLARSRVQSGDVFILDLGTKIYQWNGKESNKDERFKAMQYLNNLKSERGDATSQTLEEDAVYDDHPFYLALTAKDVPDAAFAKPVTAGTKTLLKYDISHVFYTSLTEQDIPDPPFDHVDAKTETVLCKVSDAAGHIKLTQVKTGAVSRKDFDSNDVFILDVGNQCFVWVGQKASPAEKQNGLGYAHQHLMKTNHPLIPISVIKEGQPSSAFTAAIAA